jgi:glycerol uptake facilitator-like aquaporin
MFGRRKIATLVAEFLGTGALTLLILSVQRSTIGVPFFVAIAAGLTIALMMFALGGISGGYFNPALTLGFWTARKLSSVTAVLYIVVQLLGAWGAYYLYTYFVKNTLQPVGGHFTGHILVAEAVGTGLFSFGVAAAVYQGFSRAVTASFAGLAFMLGIIAASSASIGLLNPAVALGVRAWVWGTYVLGPVLGAVIGVNLYGLLFAEPEKSWSSVTAKLASSTVVRTPAKGSASKKTKSSKK